MFGVAGNDIFIVYSFRLTLSIYYNISEGIQSSSGKPNVFCAKSKGYANYGRSMAYLCLLFINEDDNQLW